MRAAPKTRHLVGAVVCHNNSASALLKKLVLGVILFLSPLIAPPKSFEAFKDKTPAFFFACIPVAMASSSSSEVVRVYPKIRMHFAQNRILSASQSPPPVTKIPLTSKLAVGAFAGIIGTSAIFPIDVVKTRLQNQNPDRLGACSPSISAWFRSLHSHCYTCRPFALQWSFALLPFHYQARRFWGALSRCGMQLWRCGLRT